MKKIHIILLIAIAIIIGIIFTQVGNFSSYETFASAKQMPQSKFTVIGNLNKEKPTEYDAEKDVNYFSFYMNDKAGECCKVVFRGTKPQDFERSEQIVLTGQMADNNTFVANNILLKCPSKYTNQQAEEKSFSAIKS